MTGGMGGGTITIQKLQAEVRADTSGYDSSMQKVQVTGQQVTQEQVGQQTQVTRATDGSTMAMGGLMAAVMSLGYILKENSGIVGAAWDVAAAAAGMAVDNIIEDAGAASGALQAAFGDTASGSLDKLQGSYKKAGEASGEFVEDLVNLLPLGSTLTAAMDKYGLSMGEAFGTVGEQYGRLVGAIGSTDWGGIGAQMNEPFRQVQDYDWGGLGGRINKALTPQAPGGGPGDQNSMIGSLKAVQDYDWGGLETKVRGALNPSSGGSGHIGGQGAGGVQEALKGLLNQDWRKFGGDMSTAFSKVDWAGIEKSTKGMAQNIKDFWDGVSKANQKQATDAMDKLKGWLTSL